MRVSNRQVLSFSLLASVVAGCNYDPPKPPPPRHCVTADECLALVPNFNIACGWSAEGGVGIPSDKWGRIPYQEANTQVQAYNFHDDKNILATVETTIDTQLPEAAQTVYTPILVKPLPKSTVRGGRPDGIDSGGQPKFIGCQFVRKDNLIQRYTFEVKKACFEHETSCDPAPPYTKPEPTPPLKESLARCEHLCSSNDPAQCSRFEPSSALAQPITNLTRLLLTNPLPTGVDFKPIFDAIASSGYGQVCQTRRLTINEASDAMLAGDYCRLPLATPSGTAPERQSAVLDIPTTTKAEFSRVTARPAIAYLSFDIPTAITVQYYKLPPEDTASPVVKDPIVAAYFSINRLLFAGRSEACFMVDLKNGD